MIRRGTVVKRVCDFKIPEVINYFPTHVENTTCCFVVTKQESRAFYGRNN